jgi:hypothetical protein
MAEVCGGGVRKEMAGFGVCSCDFVWGLDTILLLPVRGVTSCSIEV